MGIKQKMVMLSVMAGLAILIISGIGYFQVYESLGKSAEHELSSQVRVQAEIFDGWLREKQRVAVSGASLMTAFKGQKDEENLRELLRLQGRDEDILNIAYGDERGYFYGLETGAHPGTDPHSRPWYRQLAEGKKSTFTEPYEDLSTGKMVVSAVAPFEDEEGNFAGGICVDITLDSLLGQVREMRYPEAGAGFLFNHRGKLILSSSGNVPVGEDIGHIGPLASHAELILGQEEGIFDIRGENLVAFSRIPSTGWIFCLTVPEGVVYAPLSKAKITYGILALFGLMAVLLLVVFCLRFSTGITKSLAAVEEYAREIAKGNLALGSLAITRRDEIGSLTDSFNTMTHDLGNMVRTMSEASREVADAALDLRQHVELAVQASRQITELTDGVAGDMAQQMKNVEIMLASVDTSFAGMDELYMEAEQLAENLSLLEESLAVLQQDTQALLESQGIRETGDGILQCVEGLSGEMTRLREEAQRVHSMAKAVQDETGHAVDTVGAIDEISRSTAGSSEEIKKSSQKQEESILEIVAAARSMESLAANIRDTIARFRV